MSRFIPIFISLAVLLGCARQKPNPELTEPVFALQAAAALKLYSALPVAKDTDPETARLYAQAAQDPRLWRQLERRERFDAILLNGDPAAYRPLLKHLADTKDWTLTYLDHTSLVFKKAPAPAWKPADLEPVRAKFASRPVLEQVTFLVQGAARLLAVEQTLQARKFLEEALKLDERSAPAWIQSASYNAHVGRWTQALADVDRASALEKNSLPAKAVKAQILLALQKPTEALDLSRELLKQAPKDPTTLFRHARIAHEAKAYADEIQALGELIALAERDQRSVSGYRIYLGQAYASRSDAEAALKEFDLALAAGDLSEEQIAFVKEAIERIKSRTNL